MVKEGRKMYLKLNPADYALVKVPNLVFKTKRRAIPTLEALGFKMSKFTYKGKYCKDLVLYAFNGKRSRQNSNEQLP
jgi:hypothetical protein